MQSTVSTLNRLIKARYGNWLLVQLPSSQWAAVWAAVLNDEDMCASVLDGTWFHAENPTFPTRAGALRRIVEGIEREMGNTRDPNGREVFNPLLQSARAALARPPKFRQ